LAIRPIDASTPAALVRPYVPPLGRKSLLKCLVAANRDEEWEFRVVIDGQIVSKCVVGTSKGAWEPIAFDLSDYAGRRVVVRLENAGLNRRLGISYWSDLQIEDGALRASSERILKPIVDR